MSTKKHKNKNEKKKKYKTSISQKIFPQSGLQGVSPVLPGSSSLPYVRRNGRRKGNGLSSITFSGISFANLGGLSNPPSFKGLLGQINVILERHFVKLTK